MGVVDTEKSQISLGPHRKIDISDKDISLVFGIPAVGDIISAGTPDPSPACMHFVSTHQQLVTKALTA